MERGLGGEVSEVIQERFLNQMCKAVNLGLAMLLLWAILIPLTILFGQGVALAGDIQMGAQLIDTEHLLGTLSGRFKP